MAANVQKCLQMAEHSDDNDDDNDDKMMMINQIQCPYNFVRVKRCVPPL